MKIYWDFANRKLLSSMAAAQQIQSINWVLRDKEYTELVLVEYDDDTGGYVVADIPSGYTIRFSLKATASRDGAPLAWAYSWSLGGTGDDRVYSATILLNSPTLISAVTEDGATSGDFVGEFVFEDASENNRDSTQIDITVTEDVHQPSDSEAEVATRLQVWFEEFTDPTTQKKCMRIKNSDGETLTILSPTGVTL